MFHFAQVASATVLASRYTASRPGLAGQTQGVQRLFAQQAGTARQAADPPIKSYARPGAMSTNRALNTEPATSFITDPGGMFPTFAEKVTIYPSMPMRQSHGLDIKGAEASPRRGKLRIGGPKVGAQCPLSTPQRPAQRGIAEWSALSPFF